MPRPDDLLPVLASPGMFRQLERYLTLVFGLTLLTISTGVTFAVYHATARTEAERWLSHTYHVIAELDATLSALSDAESEERGYLLTGDEVFVDSFEHAGELARRHLDSVRALVDDNPEQQRRVDAIAEDVERKGRAMRAVIATRLTRGLEPVAPGVTLTPAPTEIGAIRRAVQRVADMERKLLEVRQRALAAAARRSGYAEVGLCGGSLAMLGLAFATVRTARRRRRRAERDSARLNAELQLRVDELVWRGRDAAGLQRLGEALQLCLTPAEAHTTVARSLPSLLGDAGDGGFLAVIRASRNRVEQVASWGTGSEQSAPAVFPPEHCCALRSGQAYVVHAGEARLPCVHTTDDVGDYMCLPLAAHGETLGVLHVSVAPAAARDAGAASLAAGDAPARARRLGLLKTASEQIAVALANLALRERLTQQTIRDPLTGAFNRRFLEEALEREAIRAERRRHGLALLMLDVDHFKRFNDQHGHEAGDHVLRTVVEVLRRTVREEDFVCRYGGEEFVILLPEIALETARARAQAVVDACRAQRVTVQGQSVDGVTVSIGLAMLAPGGSDGSELVRRADAALYAAKRAGRDRVVEAQSFDDPAGAIAA